MNKGIICRSLSLLLTLVMLLTAIPLNITVFAADAATVGGVGYSTLKEALSAAPNGSTVYINSNITLNETLSVVKNVTLTSDGGDYKIQRGAGFTGALISVTGSLTLTASSGKLTLDGASVSANSPLVNVNGGNFTLKGNTVLTGNVSSASNGSAVSVTSGVFHFAGGYIGANSSLGYGNGVYVADDNGTFKMSGNANFGSDSNVYLRASTYMEMPSELTGTSDITLYTENAYDGRRVAKVTGGFELSDSQLARFKVFSGSSAMETVYSQGSLLVSLSELPSDEDVCRIGNKKYDTLAEALEACPEGKATEIVILSSLALDFGIVISGEREITLTAESQSVISRALTFTGGAMFKVEKGSVLTLNGSLQISGSSIAANEGAIDVEGSLVMNKGVGITNHICDRGVVKVSGSFEMKGGTLSGNTVSLGTVYVSYGSFEMKGGEIRNNNAVNGGGVYLEAGSFEMKGGSISQNSAAQGSCVWAGANFTLSGSAALYNMGDAISMVYLSTDALINVAQGWEPKSAEGYSTVITIAVKELKLNAVVAEFAEEAKADNFALAESMGRQYALKADGKNIKIVSADDAYVAFYNNEGYLTIEEAFEKIPENAIATVTVVGDALMSATVTVKKGQNITLIAGESILETDSTIRSIKRSEDFYAPFFIVENEASLSIGAPEGKTLCIDGESKEVSGSAFTVYGILGIGEGALIKANNNKKGENLTQTPVYTFGGAVLVGEKGVCTLSGGAIEGCYASMGGAVYVTDGLLNLSGGSISKNSAIFGGAVYLNTATLYEKQQIKQGEEPLCAVFNMTEGSLKENSAWAVPSVKYSGLGGAILAGNGSKAVLSGGDLTSNKAAHGSAAAIGNMPAKADDPFDAPSFVLTKTVVIAEDNGIYLTIPGSSFVRVTESLEAQKSAIELTIPDSLPAHMPLVKFDPEKTEDDKKDEEERVVSAKPAIEKKLFKLEKSAAEKYGLSVSALDESLIINTTEDGVFAGYKSGRYYNAITRYKTVKNTGDDEKSEEKKEEKEEKKTQLSYEPITVGEKGIFSVYYEMNYYLDGYKSITPMLTAPFAKGTKITMIDTTGEENTGYYYYVVTGEEKVKEKGSATEILDDDGRKLISLDTVEIPLSDFCRMGTESEGYKLQFSSDAKEITEKVTFVVDMTEAEIEETRTSLGDFVMVWNHYVVDSKLGLKYDISEFIGHAKYTVTDEKHSKIDLSFEDKEISVSYTLSPESAAIASKQGVIMLSLGTRFPKGTVLTDEKGNSYTAPERSSLLAIAIPRDSKGNIVKNGSLTLTLSNYYGTKIPESSLRAYIYPSNDGKHYADGADYDARSESVTLSLAPADEYGILVTTLDGKDKPFYEGCEKLLDKGSLEMKVKAVVNAEETDKFRLFLEKKQKDGSYKQTALSELFVIGDKKAEMVELGTGNISLELRADLEKLKGSEFKIGFKNEKAVEYIKVNITK